MDKEMKKLADSIKEDLYDYLADWKFDKVDLINDLRKLADYFESQKESLK